MSPRSRSKLDRLPEILTAATLVLLPFIHTGQTMDPVTTLRLVTLSVAVLVIGGALLLVAHRGSGKTLSLQHHIAFYALIGYLLTVALSLTQAGNLAEGVLTSAKAALWAALVILFTIVFVRSPGAFGLFARCLTLVAAALAIIGVCQYYEVAFVGYASHAGLANRNLLASALCLMLPFVLSVIVQSYGFWRWSGVATAALVAAMVILSNSRATWLGLLMAGAGALIIWRLLARPSRFSSRQRTSGRRGLVIAATVMVVTAATFATSYVHRVDQESVLTRVTSAADFERGSVAERLAMWRNSLAMLGDHPWLGVGAGNWKLVSPAYDLISDRQMKGNLFFQRPHNDYLWILSESGPLALLCYLIVFTSAFRRCLRVIKTSEHWPDVTTATTIMSGLILYMVDAFFSYPMEQMVHTLLVALMVGAALSFSQWVGPVRADVGGRAPVAMIIAAMVLTIPALLIGITRLGSEVHIKSALAARAQGDWAAVIREVDAALSRWIQIDHTATPLAWHRGVANFTLEEYDAAFDDFKAAFRVHPNHLHVLNNLATCYERDGKHDSAEYYYRRALQIVPGFEETVINLAAVQYNAGRFDEALQTLESIPPPSGNDRYNLYLERIRAKRGSLPPNP